LLLFELLVGSKPLPELGQSEQGRRVLPCTFLLLGRRVELVSFQAEIEERGNNYGNGADGGSEDD
jgi:hypothetical protein